MSNEDINNMLAIIDSACRERTRAFIFMAEIENENGELFTVKHGSRSNATSVGLATMFIHDVHQARDSRVEDEA